MAEPAIRFGLDRTLPYPAARVWALVGHFSRLPEWFPGIGDFASEGNQPGALRTIVIPPFPPVRHRLAVQDDGAMFTEYRVVDGPGLSEDTGFVVTIRVLPAGEGACRVDWQARLARRPGFVPEGGEAAFAARTQASYERAIDHLQSRLAAAT